MKRRDVLKNIGLGTAGVAVGGKTFAQSPAAPKKITHDDLPDAENGFTRDEIVYNKKLTDETFFNAHEMETIKVLADIIVPADSRSGSATDAGVPAFIEFIVKDMPQYQIPMRGGLMWLDLESKKQFSTKFIELNQANRLKLVDQIAYPEKAKPEHSQGVSFFNKMRDLTLTGFYTSEIGIKDLDYQGNTPNLWEGVPDDVLAQYKLSYKDWAMHTTK